MRNTLLFLAVLLSSLVVAQSNLSSADELYRDFSRAYAELQPEQIAKLYTVDAHIINLYDNQPTSAVTGQKAIRAFYEHYFQSVTQNQQQLRLSFKMAKRHQDEFNTITDYGCFLLEIVQKDTVVGTLYGRFCTRLRYENNRWLLQTDAATTATKSEYELSSGAVITYP
ncbi:nuclear transport factor 2 family protein [Flavobacterium sedimenticola]|uniref:Nuclear transport factor 2 family protein n=1 Tax=Flavobacterium sedimenticola TaxID=3043286 RepID=A0ABT6XP42_9FLAO|nr:nuclear transport factor 2 family protein [Flavobacterium sedimenticola]MDI9256755.1 nuclear transport factor 2 family protein [Flavobacterium sedimenticola]